MTDRKGIIIGAGSGIGRALAKLMAKAGYELGIAGQDEDALRAVQGELGGSCCVRKLDLREIQSSMSALEGLIQDVPDADLIVFCSGISPDNPDEEWRIDDEIMQVNARGCMAMANVAVRHFLKRGGGHFVGISSICSQTGSGNYPVYHASKAFMSNYLSGLRKRYQTRGIIITDIRPGYVRTAMTENKKGLFWVASSEQAARQIFDAIQKKKRVAYVTKRWSLIALAVHLVPEWFYDWIYRLFRRGNGDA